MAGRTATSLLPPIMALLFLLAGLVTVTAEPHLATAGMMPQGMMSSRSLQADAATNCPAEVATCYADATCETCFSAFTTASDECFSNAQSCSSALDGFCCAITAEEEEDCQRSDLVIEVLGAFQEARELHGWWRGLTSTYIYHVRRPPSADYHKRIPLSSP